MAQKYFASILKTTLGLSLLLGLSTQTVLAGEEALWDAERLLEAQGMPANGMSKIDNTHYERGLAALKETNYENARTQLESLQEKYPDYLPLQLTLAQVYIEEQNPDQAQELLNQIETKIPAPEERTASDQSLNLRLHHLKAMNWMIQNEPKKALEVLNDKNLNMKNFSLAEREAHNLLLSKAYQSTGQMIQAYQVLEATLEIRPVSGETRSRIQKLAPEFAADFYKKGLAAFRRQDYAEAVPLAQKAHELNQESHAYLELYLQSHLRWQEQAKQRFQKVRVPLLNGLKKIRWALEVEDFEKAREHYTEMQANPELAFFIQPSQRLILPIAMQQTLDSLERSLQTKAQR